MTRAMSANTALRRDTVSRTLERICCEGNETDLRFLPAITANGSPLFCGSDAGQDRFLVYTSHPIPCFRVTI